MVDLSRVLAGPYCTMVLADLGADVVKVERPEGGDETRTWGPPFAGGEAAYYLSVNRGKRSCAIDLSQTEGRALALDLCAAADVVVENFKVGGAERLGVGYEQVRERNPRVVYCSITGFGSRREPPGRPGYDFVAQAETGLMSITGPEDGPPYKVGVALVDVLTGLHAAAAILAGLHGGEGARVEVPLLDSGLAGLVNVAQNALVTGRDPERHGNAHPNIVPYQDFETATARIAVAAANDGLFRALCRVLERPELGEDERFATNAARVENRRELIPLLQERLLERPAEEWVEGLDAAGVPVGAVRTVPDALAAAAQAGRPATLTVDHPSAGALELVASPIWGLTDGDAATPPPLLGEHTAEVLGELGRSEEEIAALVARKVVRLIGEPDISGGPGAW
ncbi:MAG TPA: CaiB/BaiF CoA-transferase family protein, partial [Thermoleophilaceae bacterium]|nr:CaiB/BaiF CoA-transferase family protein [Thermoleophilaceae bacterium]